MLPCGQVTLLTPYGNQLVERQSGNKELYYSKIAGQRRWESLSLKSHLAGKLICRQLINRKAMISDWWVPAHRWNLDKWCICNGNHLAMKCYSHLQMSRTKITLSELLLSLISVPPCNSELLLYNRQAWVSSCPNALLSVANLNVIKENLLHVIIAKGSS